MNKIGQRIRDLRKLAGLTQPDLAARCGWDSQSRISMYEKGNREPGLHDIDLISKALGVTSQYLLFGNHPAADSTADPQGDDSGLATAPPKANPYIEVARHRIQLDTNNKPTLIQTGEEPVPISFKVIQDRELNIGNLAAIMIADDAMRPHIESGDILIIDTSDTTPRDGRVYVLAYGDEWFVRRMFKKPNNGLIITADNNQYREIDVQPSDTEYISIVGRVVWRGG
ncbi:XRE family transcriptional regulator [Chromobacterium subtsugae]|uniref:XRE family transcriptional regulator n=1 Tax=Chromobacterium subtsugae TaxID=251747 RepID=UPI001364DA6D|nr:LexA family transcriptional regulator [Chromobacterium subtsugae]